MKRNWGGIFFETTPKLDKQRASYLRQDKIAKPTNTVHIVSMNVTSGEVRIVHLVCVKSPAREHSAMFLPMHDDKDSLLAIKS